jgi:hypothetical protein
MQPRHNTGGSTYGVPTQNRLGLMAPIERIGKIASEYQ